VATHRRASDTSAVQHRWGSREELPPPTPHQKGPLSYKVLRGRAPRDVKVSGEKHWLLLLNSAATKPCANVLIVGISDQGLQARATWTRNC